MRKPPPPPFSLDTAIQKAHMAEDAWNSRGPTKVAPAYSEDSRWRHRVEFLTGRAEIEGILTRKWAREREYRLIKEVWACTGDRIAVRFVYESQDGEGQWFRSHGNENWEFDGDGPMWARHASINDMPTDATERLFSWPLGPRPADHPGLGELGL